MCRCTILLAVMDSNVMGKKKSNCFSFSTFVVVKMSVLIKILIISAEESVSQFFLSPRLKTPSDFLNSSACDDLNSYFSCI